MKTLAFVLPLLALAAAVESPSSDALFERLERRYVREFLRRNPVVSTYLGGAGRDPGLAAADGALRDWSPAALAAEARLWRELREELAALPAEKLSPRRRIDREVALHQIDFMLHQDQERKYWQRALDTYVNEAFRGVDWYTLGMTSLGSGRHGTEAEWRTVAARVAAVPAYLRQARLNLEEGVRAGHTPDGRMIEKDGLQSSAANAEYFAETLPALATARTPGQPFSDEVRALLRTRGAEAARAFREFHDFVGRSLATLPRQDRYLLGEKEYDWALRNNLNVPFSSAELYESSWPVVEDTRRRMMQTAEEVARRRGLDLPWDETSRGASTRAVLQELGKDRPRDDAEMVRWYHDAALRLVQFARENALFDIPADYELEVAVTPPTLEASIDGAAYYPAPPLKSSGVGRFYVTPTKGDPAKLAENNRHAVADLSAHEGFPGHDWHFKVMTRERDLISPVRWLTPGEVEGSSSMWEDSMAAEGWALYAEALMAEPTAKAPGGFYTAEERLYQLQGQLYRDLRVRIDTGLHTGRIGFDQAVDLFSGVVDFLPGSCSAGSLSPEKKASCESAQRAIFRYSKWPTQAVTYRLGKDRIYDLRARAEKVRPGPEGRRRFHLLFMQQGTIPPGYFEDALLDGMKAE
ncbi:MAG TPA: DUF885 domain-containing protein [Vicinamibacteria bacterium]|nr:DUF885 domain-containing protein [Vicinamibacteria bacterium]